MNTDVVKGFRDFTGKEAFRREAIKRIISEIFQTYGFEVAETPLVEYEEFVRGENTNDEAISEIYKLQDRGKRNLALRYEFTFQLKRLMKGKKLPFKRYQIGEVFRDEPISENRFRQFTQCDVDVIASKTIDEAEILSIVRDVLKRLKIDFVIYVNNRKLLNEILFNENILEEKREEVIRIVDKLDKKSLKEVKEELKQFGAEKLISIFQKDEKYFERYESYSEIKELKKYCKQYSVNVEFLPSLARGLSYYNGTIFEIKTSKMKETICGGGSYIFNNTQCSGLAFGLDRLAKLAKIEVEKKRIMVLSINENRESIKIARRFRKEGKIVYLWTGKTGKGMEYANSVGVLEVFFVGQDEVKKKKIKVRDMKTGKERFEKF